MNHSDTGSATADAAPSVHLADHVVRLSPSEYDLAAILEFDPEASIAPGSMIEALGLQLSCPVPVSHFSMDTWRRLFRGFEDYAGPPMCSDLSLWHFLERRRTDRVA